MKPSKTTAETIARRVLISGRVQGVGYRYGLAELARKLNITGWCRNLPSGQVEAWVQGSRHTVEQLLNWMQQGPSPAIVEHIAIEEQAVLEPMLRESIETFEIRR